MLKRALVAAAAATVALVLAPPANAEPVEVETIVFWLGGDECLSMTVPVPDARTDVVPETFCSPDKKYQVTMTRELPGDVTGASAVIGKADYVFCRVLFNGTTVAADHAISGERDPSCLEYR